MSSQLPPDPYFNNINFNPSFFIDNDPFLTETIANSKYLKLTGGTLTGNLNVSYANPVLTIRGTAENQTAILYLSTPSNSSNVLKTAIFSEGISSWNRSKMLFCLNNQPDAINNATIADARMTILPNGNVGIANTSPSSIFQIGAGGRLKIANDANDYTLIGTTDADNSTTNTSILLQGRTGTFTGSPGTIFYFASDGTSGGHAFFCGGSQRMRIKNNGNLGIANTDPSNILQVGNGGRLRIANDANDYTYIGTADSENTTTNTSILLQGKTGTFTGSPGTIFYFASDGTSGGHAFFCGGSQRIRIKNNGNLGIANGDPSNILQVGSGQRLRISNGNDDYTQIGASDTAGINNASIVLSGSTRSTNPGNIEYTAKNNHRFFSTSTGSYIEKLDIDPNDFIIYNSCTTIGDNYYTEGQYLPYQTKTNTSGQSKSGYFHSTEWWYNSFVNFACSHTSPNYSYWHGHIGTNNDSAVLYFSPTSSNQTTIESFTEQGTNKIYIFMVPNYGGFLTGIQMRVKFYG